MATTAIALIEASTPLRQRSAGTVAEYSRKQAWVPTKKATGLLLQKKDYNQIIPITMVHGLKIPCTIVV